MYDVLPPLAREFVAAVLAKLGHTVLATDGDVDALRVCRANAARNGVAGRVSVHYLEWGAQGSVARPATPLIGIAPMPPTDSHMGSAVCTMAAPWLAQWHPNATLQWRVGPQNQI